MIQASAKIDALEDQKYPDGDGSEVAEELRGKEYRLKKVQEAMEALEREKLATVLAKVNGTNPESRLMKDSRKVIQPRLGGVTMVR